jgi:hypothetical protein
MLSAQVHATADSGESADSDDDAERHDIAAG